jgi:hypothetical protein
MRSIFFASIVTTFIGLMVYAAAVGVQIHAANNDSNSTTTLAQKGQTDTVTTEGSAQSTQDALIGHEHHQAVVVLPLREDHKMWVGTISWTSSKPVELRLLYDYNSSLVPDANHGKPVTAPLALSTEPPHIPIGEVGISLIKPYNGPPTVSSFNSGTMQFAAKAVALHSVNGTKFTVNYAVDATAKAMNK